VFEVVLRNAVLDGRAACDVVDWFEGVLAILVDVGVREAMAGLVSVPLMGIGDCRRDEGVLTALADFVVVEEDRDIDEASVGLVVLAGDLLTTLDGSA